METFRIQGGNPLHGDVVVSGAKNAALPVLAATLLTTDECIVDNVPQIADIETMCELLRRLGCRVEFDKKWHRVIVQSPEHLGTDAPYELVRKMRASFLVAGPILARERVFTSSHPGGCAIGTRPVNVDVNGFASMGARIELAGRDYHVRADGGLKGDQLYLDYPSVTGTENLMLSACLARGTTYIKHAATEPEISVLADCLRKMGAKIEGDNTGYITITGVDALHGVHYRIPPDRIEAGTFAIGAAISKGELVLHDVVLDHMDPLTHKLREIGVEVDCANSTYYIRANGRLRPVEVQALRFPGFPTDLQAAITTLLTQADGTSRVYERVFDDRFSYVGELEKMGACIGIEGQKATVQGPSRLRGGCVKATDIRAGAALVLAGLAAEGETTITDEVGHINRGYEGIDRKFRALGAAIERVPA